MNPSVFGGSAALLLVLTWLITRRRPVVLLRSTDASAVAALNRAQITRLRDQAGAEIPGFAGSRPPEISLPLPAAGDRRGRARLLRELGQRLQGSTAERRAAITTAASWGDRAALPLLRRGLRDADPQVVLTAADGIALFRGRSAAQAVRQTPERVPLPRNGAPQWRG